MAMAPDITIDDMIEAVNRHALEMQAKAPLFGPDSWHAKQAAILHAAVAILQGVRRTDDRAAQIGRSISRPTASRENR